MLKAFMAGVIILVAALPATAEIRPRLSNTDIASNPQSYASVCTNDRYGRLSVRTGPGQNYRKITEVSNGITVALMAGQYGQDGFYWWNINHNGIRGWVRSDYICN
ncbi:hypothetical protein CLI64_07235 [Nostoc sp. CENA543]|uniref:SH3 domain-containing protein n=1 Tax=Nostoc sp. CENA543 TaxID=1869241 RepID=UPI000CA20EBF|nr:SH3 domain-containing protein [Nostoc sp. CENA543]AUT00191.1 hypothetical protein CLI64_07235 [Nostoc sp. CENA543]